MKTFQLLALALVIAAVGFFASGTLRSVDAQSGGSPTVVGVVDLEKVMNDSKEFAAKKAEVAAAAQANQEELAGRQQGVASLKTELDTLDPSSDAALAKQLELIEAGTAMKAWAEVKQRLAQNQQARGFIGVYSNAMKSVSAVAQEAGVDLVMTKGQSLNPQQVPAEASLQQIAAAVLADSKVVYSKDAVDLTARVITRMNADFEAMQ